MKAYFSKLTDLTFVVPVAVVAILAVMLYNNIIQPRLPVAAPTA